MKRAEKWMIFSEIGFETQSIAPIMIGNIVSNGPPVIIITDTLQSHFSAVVGKVDGQGMK